MTDEFISFVKQRVAIEESYGKALVKLSKQGCDVAEIGTLRVAWDTLRSGTYATREIAPLTPSQRLRRTE